jgi:hypothetical protein
MAGLIQQDRNVDLLLPSTISYSDPKTLNFQNKSHYWNLLRIFLEAIGLILRNTFYFPLHKKMDFDHMANQNLAARISNFLKSDSLCPEKLERIRKFFHIRDIDVHLSGPLSKIFTVRLFESKTKLHDKKLRIILFSFNGNSEVEEGKQVLRPWDPRTIKEMSECPLLVLRAFQTTGVAIDSLMTFSLGNIALGNLRDFSSEAAEILPSTLIINRGFTSSKKVANHFFIFPFNHILYFLGKLCGWSADPESELLSYLEENSQKFVSQHKILIIEDKKDFYFSEESAPNENYHTKLSRLGNLVCRLKFWPFPFHRRAHHALGLNHLVNNPETEMLANTMQFFLRQDEKMSSAISRNIFMSNKEEWHTCFCIGGADSTLETGTVREVLPLLSAFIKG